MTMKLPILALLCLLTLTTHAAETTLIGNDRMTNWIYTPTEKPAPSKTYWLVVGVHGAGGNGKGACDVASWAGDFDDVIVLGPSFQQARPANTNRPNASSATTSSTTNTPAAPRPAGMPGSAYQMNGPAHEAKLRELIAVLGRTWKLHPKIFLHGFSAGAQFTHRFAFRNPELVVGVSAHSGGSWAKLEGDDRINPLARSIPFVVSCGEDDQGTGGPRGTPPRIEGAKLFATNLQSLGFTVELKTWPGIGHAQTGEAKAMGKALLEKLRTEQAASKTVKP